MAFRRCVQRCHAAGVSSGPAVSKKFVQRLGLAAIADRGRTSAQGQEPAPEPLIDTSSSNVRPQDATVTRWPISDATEFTRPVTMASVSDAAHDQHNAPHGTSLLPRDLTPEELASAPVLASVDALLIDGLTDDEYDAFIAALSS